MFTFLVTFTAQDTKKSSTLLVYYVIEGNLDSWGFVHRPRIVITNLFYFNELDTFYNIHSTFCFQPNGSNIIKEIIYGKISKSLKPKILHWIAMNCVCRVGSVVKSTCFLCRGSWVRFSAPTWYLRTLYNFNIMGSNTLF